MLRIIRKLDKYVQLETEACGHEYNMALSYIARDKLLDCIREELIRAHEVGGQKALAEVLERGANSERNMAV